MAELFFLLAVVVLPQLLGGAVALLRRPWWWAAMAAIVVAMTAAIAPTPEAGEARLIAGDLVFLLVVALWVTGLAWIGFILVRKAWVDRGRSTASPSA